MYSVHTLTTRAICCISKKVTHFLPSVAIIQYLAEKYGKDDTFYPKDDLRARSIIHHRLAFYLSTYYRRVHDYMVAKILTIRRDNERV